jgi:hypothetical protein
MDLETSFVHCRNAGMRDVSCITIIEHPWMKLSATLGSFCNAFILLRVGWSLATVLPPLSSNFSTITSTCVLALLLRRLLEEPRNSTRIFSRDRPCREVKKEIKLLCIDQFNRISRLVWVSAIVIHTLFTVHLDNGSYKLRFEAKRFVY